MTDSLDTTGAEPAQAEGISQAIAQAADSVPHTAADLLERLGERVGGRASAAAVFGEPIGRDGVTVIPVASVAYGFGGRHGPESDSHRGVEGGGGGTSRPIGFIEISGGTAVFKPIRDPLRDFAIPLAALLSTTAGTRISRVLARRRQRKELS
jgi:Sporulation protein YtfJ (Spore_YtfJ)